MSPIKCKNVANVTSKNAGLGFQKAIKPFKVKQINVSKLIWSLWQVLSDADDHFDLVFLIGNADQMKFN